MPIFNKDFLDRIKTNVVNKVDQRIKKELEPNIVPRQIGYNPNEAPEDEQVDQSFYNRIKEKVKDKVRNLSPVQQKMLDANAVLDLPTIKYRIQYAAQNRLIMMMRYNSVWRHVSPYSYRVSPKTGKLLFYGFCHLHNEIHAFKLDKIDGLLVTDQTYSPKWAVEF